GSIGVLGTPLVAGYGQPVTVESGDLDGDSRPDLVVLLDRGQTPDGRALARVAIQKNLGGGLFASPAILDDAPVVPPIAARPVDWDGDGDLDIVVAELTGRDAARLQIYLNDGQGHFQPDPDSPVPLPDNAGSGAIGLAKGLAVLWDGSYGEGPAPGHLVVVTR